MRAVALALVWAFALGGCRTGDEAHPQTVMGEDCDRCHLGSYQGALFDHASVGYDVSCGRCHLQVDWQPVKPAGIPKHDGFFPLQDAHEALECGQCHALDRAKPQPRVCNGCHTADLARISATVPDHAKFPEDCAQCHKPVRWEDPPQLDHSVFYPLSGKHTTQAACDGCHTEHLYIDTPTECVDCHGDVIPADHNDGRGFACQGCHTPNGW